MKLIFIKQGHTCLSAFTLTVSAAAVRILIFLPTEDQITSSFVDTKNLMALN